MAGLTGIEGIGPALAAACAKNNYRTIAKISIAKPDELSAVPGISKERATLIINSAKSLLSKPVKDTAKAKKPVVAPLQVGKKVAPVKVSKKAVVAQSTRKSTDKTKQEAVRKPAKKTSVKSLTNSSEKEKKMSAKTSKDKIKKLKKKIKKLKAEKKGILAKEAKKVKKAKAKKTSKKK